MSLAPIATVQDAGLRACIDAGKVTLVDETDDLALYHYAKPGNGAEIQEPERHYRGWIVDKETGQVVVKGEADYTDIVLDSQDALDGLEPDSLYQARQVTKLRLFEWKGHVYVSTHMKLDASKSHWGIYRRSFAEMFRESGLERHLVPGFLPSRYNNNGCEDMYVEAKDNQFVINNTCPMADTVHFAREYYSAPVDTASLSIDQDIYLVDPVLNVRYLSPSMYRKLHEIRNINEPNLLRRFFVLKGHGHKLLSILPADQHTWLAYIVADKERLINKAIKLGHFQPTNVQDGGLASFNKLSGLDQYKIIERAILDRK